MFALLGKLSRKSLDIIASSFENLYFIECHLHTNMNLMYEHRTVGTSSQCMPVWCYLIVVHWEHTSKGHRLAIYCMSTTRLYDCSTVHPKSIVVVKNYKSYLLVIGYMIRYNKLYTVLCPNSIRSPKVHRWIHFMMCMDSWIMDTCISALICTDNLQGWTVLQFHSFLRLPLFGQCSNLFWRWSLKQAKPFVCFIYPLSR